MFNRNARWDRGLPFDEDPEAIDEPIYVTACFDRGRIEPRSFIWRKRKYLIKQTTYYWQENRGEIILHHFSLSDGINLFQIYLNAKDLTWRIHKACTL